MEEGINRPKPDPKAKVDWKAETQYRESLTEKELRDYRPSPQMWATGRVCQVTGMVRHQDLSVEWRGNPVHHERIPDTFPP